MTDTGRALTDTHCQIQIHAPPEVIYAVLWDVGRYPQFLTHVIDAGVIENSNPEQITVELCLDMIRTFECRFDMRGHPTSRVRWWLTEAADVLESHAGGWTIEAGTNPRTCMLDYKAKIQLKEAIPDSLMGRIVDFDVPTMLRQVKARAEFVARRTDPTV